MINSSNEFDVLTDRLINEIKSQAPNVRDDIALASAQCIMKRESKESEKNQEIYAAWVSVVRGKGVF